MKYYVLLLFIGLVACKTSSNKQDPHTLLTSDTLAKPDINQLLKLYQPLMGDTIEIDNQRENERAKWRYQGTQIDSILLNLLPTYYEGQEPLYYACYKFDLDSNTVGLITRTPSDYESSSIKLFAWHKKNDTITFETELAESWGDAGDAMTKTSWLYHHQQSGWMGILEQFNYSEDLNDTTAPISETYDYYHFKWANNRIDTISRDSSALVAIYNQIAPKKGKATTGKGE
ncbi:MAG: hypothetical protein J7623_09640 [Chitinophaga sp.]|uniref:hypothetical protein n=1 Tax=Chitinophaga sp. TaxID=1869181 RepID=UPI001B135A38|nr:hypothetical protein [Chitinophaga sp.]MBO9728886.1 hypothetical protein [Chitinophaga sp.]